MIYTLKRAAYLYHWELGKTLPSYDAPDHEGKESDTFQLVGFVGNYVILYKNRGLDHGRLYAAPEGWMKNTDAWWAIEG